MSFDLEQRIKRLESYKNSSSPILSVYFKLPIPKKVTHATIVNKFQTFLNARLTLEQREKLNNQIRYILGFMENYQQGHGEKTIAFFAGGDSLFEVLHLPYSIETTIRYSYQPFLEPLLKSYTDRKRYLFILSERKRAIIYTMYSGYLEDREYISNDKVPQYISGRWPDSPRSDRRDKVNRHVGFHVKKHFEYVADRAMHFLGKRKISGVILGGHKSEIGKFEKHLPKRLKDIVAGRFVSDLKTGFSDILARSEKVLGKIDNNLAA